MTLVSGIALSIGALLAFTQSILDLYLIAKNDSALARIMPFVINFIVNSSNIIGSAYFGEYIYDALVDKSMFAALSATMGFSLGFGLTFEFLSFNLLKEASYILSRDVNEAEVILEKINSIYSTTNSSQNTDEIGDLDISNDQEEKATTLNINKF